MSLLITFGIDVYIIFFLLENFFNRWLVIFHGKIIAALKFKFFRSFIIFIADPGVNLLILYFDLSKINLIFVSSKPQQFKSVFPFVAAPKPYTFSLFFKF